MDLAVRQAERVFRQTGEEEARREWVIQLVRSGALEKLPFDVQLKPGKTGGQIQAAEGKWYTIARYHPAKVWERNNQLVGPNTEFVRYAYIPGRYVDSQTDTTMCIIHHRGCRKQHKDPKWAARITRYHSFSCTAKLPSFWIDYLLDYRPTEWTDKHKDALTAWYLHGGAVYNPGAP